MNPAVLVNIPFLIPFALPPPPFRTLAKLTYLFIKMVAKICYNPCVNVVLSAAVLQTMFGDPFFRFPSLIQKS